MADRKNIHIEDSYCVWTPSVMRSIISLTARDKYKRANAELLLHRTYRSMIIEWWLHNIGYYLTKPFCKIEAIDRLNKRFKDVDLEERE